MHPLHVIVPIPHQIPMVDGLLILPLDSENGENTPSPMLNNPTSSSSPTAFSEKGQEIEEGFEEGKIVRMKSSESTSKLYFFVLRFFY
jgi:hypothetical protein